MKKDFILKIVSLSVIAFICLISCGIPSIFVPDTSDFSSNRVSSFDTNIHLSLSNNLANPSINKPGFPKLALFYQIIPTGPDSAEKGFDAVRANFNTLFCDSQNGQRISYSDKNQPYHSYSYKYDSKTVDFGLYQFKVDNEFINYFDTANLTDLDGQFRWILDFDYGSEDNKNDGTLKLLLRDPADSDKVLKEFNLTRYNNQPFIPNLDTAYIGQEIPEVFSDKGITKLTLSIYALVNTEFNDYNNIYNTKLVGIGDFELQ